MKIQRSFVLGLSGLVCSHYPAAIAFSPQRPAGRTTMFPGTTAADTPGRPLSMLPKIMGAMLEKTTDREYNAMHHSPKEKNHKDEWDLDREVLRLDSLGNYVLVSILAATSSRASLDNNNWEDHAVASGSFLEILHTTQMLVSTMSIFAGIYATIMFSLCILYGKTALGMQRDRVYDYLLGKTYNVRVRAFQAFLSCLFLFIVENGLIAMERVPEEIRPVVGVASLAFIAFTSWEAHHIISYASLIFRPEKGSTTSRRDDTQGADLEEIASEDETTARIKSEEAAADEVVIFQDGRPLQEGSEVAECHHCALNGALHGARSGSNGHPSIRSPPLKP